jgi:hypothetical protein
LKGKDLKTQMPEQVVGEKKTYAHSQNDRMPEEKKHAFVEKNKTLVH